MQTFGLGCRLVDLNFGDRPWLWPATATTGRPFWCQDAWHQYRERYDCGTHAAPFNTHVIFKTYRRHAGFRKFPAWAKVRVIDTSKASHTQVTPNSLLCFLCYVSICTAPPDRSDSLVIQLSSAGICSVAFQVANVKVLIPSTEVINAATDLRLIVNHGAGTDRCFSIYETHLAHATQLAQAELCLLYIDNMCTSYTIFCWEAGYNNIDIKAAQARGVPVLATMLHRWLREPS